MRGRSFGLAVLGVVLVAASCGGNAVEDEAVVSTTEVTVKRSATSVEAGGSVSIGVEIKPETLDPMPNGGPSAPGQSYATQALYDSLTGVNELDGSVEARLAESFEPNADFTQWTITLRDGVRVFGRQPCRRCSRRRQLRVPFGSRQL